MNDCGNCRHTNHLDLPDFSTMPCAACARYGADNDPTMWEAKPMTNYDRLISKTPEELARYYAKRIARCYGCQAMTEDDCFECQLDWLKSPAEEGSREE